MRRTQIRRGPIWVPMNYLLIEALERYRHYWGDDLQVEFPAGSGNLMNLGQIAHEITRRLTRLFLPEENGRRACFGATHQTGWTTLITRCMNMVAREEEEAERPCEGARGMRG